MKQLFFLFVLLIAVSDTNAQLLKKLKEKAAKAIEPKKTSDNSSSDEPGSANKNTGNHEAATAAATVPAGPPANGSVVFSLGADEKFLHDETSITYRNNQVTYSFVLQNKQYEYFLVENGKRSGPFKEAPLKSLKEREDFDDGSSNSGDEINLGADQKDPVALKYSKTIDGKLYLVFKGKNYGPYDHVAKMIVSPNQQQFFALVTIGSENPMMAKMGMGNAYMVNEAGLKVRAGSESMSVPMKFSVSNEFKHCMATVLEQKSQTVMVVTSANKKQESSMADMYSGGNSKTMLSSQGDIISIPSQSPTQVLVNGKEAAAFKVPIKSLDRLFLTPDISRSVYYEKGKMYRADGTEESLSGVLFPSVVTSNNETAVYYFKIYKNETGARDVYLCKKVI